VVAIDDSVEALLCNDPSKSTRRCWTSDAATSPGWTLLKAIKSVRPDLEVSYERLRPRGDRGGGGKPEPRPTLTKPFDNSPMSSHGLQFGGAKSLKDRTRVLGEAIRPRTISKDMIARNTSQCGRCSGWWRRSSTPRHRAHPGERRHARTGGARHPLPAPAQGQAFVA